MFDMAPWSVLREILPQLLIAVTCSLKCLPLAFLPSLNHFPQFLMCVS